ncbi:glycosyltransferase family 2 protein [Cloacibacillus evryensis]|uniref:glycosyltransferase family 2 protein n=1 Tax=Cloacibacillus evryensis TaxID=508460 RepID=UPI0022E04E72|nr:glycosyltransferase family 2 protein [Cloacibacillus evryensis]
MKTISILVPTYNEEDNITALVSALYNELKNNLASYDYEIIFIDNYSHDTTRSIINSYCQADEKVKAIFNARNFGFSNSQVHGLLQTSGECTILLYADLQEPVEMISSFVHEWENGYKLVIGQKTASEESKIMYRIRSIYYGIIKKWSDIEQIEHFTGFGLYDKSFINILRTIEDPAPFLRGIVAEFGYKIKIIHYKQKTRKTGKSNFNFYRLYDLAMLSITSYTKVGLRFAVFCGVIIGFFSILIGLIYLILKLVYWDRFPAGAAPILIGMMFLGAIQLFFIGFIGEYILTINTRVMKRPLVIEEKRINFKKDYIK